MRKLIVTAFIMLIVFTGFSQAGSNYQKILDSISKVVIHYMQEKEPDSIYALAGQNFKQQLSQESFKSISTNQIFPLNDFKAVTFVNTTNGINKYKVDGNPVRQLLLSLDTENKIETLLIQPFSNN